MGGYGSGRGSGKPLANEALTIDIAWMVRTGKALPGALVEGWLSWMCNGHPSGNIRYECDMRETDNALLTLRFDTTIRATGEKHSHVQYVPLTYTRPHYGGRRWWMSCPFNGQRVGKLYCPAGAEKFASRKAYGIGYYSQRIGEYDRPFEALFALQKRLECEQGWERPIRRPKGMWKRTYAEYERRYSELDAQCSAAMMSKMSAFEGMRF